MKHALLPLMHSDTYMTMKKVTDMINENGNSTYKGNGSSKDNKKKKHVKEVEGDKDDKKEGIDEHEEEEKEEPASKRIKVMIANEGLDD